MNVCDHSSRHIPFDPCQILAAEDAAIRLFNAGFKREAISLVTMRKVRRNNMAIWCNRPYVAKLAPLKKRIYDNRCRHCLASAVISSMAWISSQNILCGQIRNPG